MKMNKISALCALALLSAGANASYISGKYARGAQAEGVITKDGKIVGFINSNIKILKPDHQMLIGAIEQNKNVFKNLTIAQVLERLPQLSTLKKALEQQGLLGSLDKSGKLTLFAPNNRAFEAIKDVAAKLSDSEFAQVLKNHLIAQQRLGAQDLKKVAAKGGAATTAAQKQLDVDETLKKVIVADIETKNGVIHIVDEVLVP
jgi:hypothetical protein